MKHLKQILFVFLIVLTVTSLQAQDENNPWALGFGTNAVDFYPTNHNTIRDADGEAAGWFSEYANVKHYNFLASPISRIHVAKYLEDGFTLGGAISFNNIDKEGEKSVTSRTYMAADVDIRYALNHKLFKSKSFDPYVSFGGSYTTLGSADDNGNGTLNAGLGLNYWLTDNVGLNLQTVYKHTFDHTLLIPHFQHALGLVIKFGGKDTDQDGIYDKQDACPEVKGLAAFKGCPDTDGDGIKDSEDGCPNEAGTAAMNGCPDTDKDGIADKNDACPKVKGTKANNGCPDTDNDGVVDSKDKCPKVKGPKANKGCPWPDTDGDGILDKDDKCPKVAGIKAEQGCPAKVVALTEEDKARLNAYAKTIYFNSSKESFKSGVSAKLDAIYDIMKEYSDSNFTIDGHTDSQGGESLNQNLSERRANAVRAYLIGKGLNASRLSSQGYGENSPIETNKTRAGRAANRRVEIKLVN